MRAPLLLLSALLSVSVAARAHWGGAAAAATAVGRALWASQASSRSLSSSPPEDPGVRPIFESATPGTPSTAPAWNAAVSPYLYIGDSLGCVSAFNLTNGTLIWTFQSGAGGVQSTPALALVPGPSNPAPLLVFGANDGLVYGVNALTGALVWNFTTGGPVLSSPVFTPDGSLVLVGSNDRSLYALNANNGTLAFPPVLTGGAVVSSPALSLDGTVAFFGSGDYLVYAVSVKTGSTLWTYLPSSSSAAIRSSPVLSLDGGTVFIGNDAGILMGLNASTGGAPGVFPDVTLAAGNPITCRPALGPALTLVVVASATGQVFLLNQTTGQILPFSSAPVGTGVSTSPAVGPDGTVYLSTPVGLFAYSGATSWTFASNAGPGASPLLGPPAGDLALTLFVGSSSNTVVALGHADDAWVFASSQSVQASPVVGPAGQLYVSLLTSSVILALNGDTGRTLWQTSLAGSAPTLPYNPVLDYLGQTLYVSAPTNLNSGNLVAISVAAAPGSIQWTAPVTATNGITCGPAVGDDGTVYVCTGQPNVVGVSITSRTVSYTSPTLAGPPTSVTVADDGTILVPTSSPSNQLYGIDKITNGVWSYSLNGTAGTGGLCLGPDGTIYVGLALPSVNGTSGGGSVAAYAARSGLSAPLWTFPTAGAVNSLPAFTPFGLIVVGADDGNVYALSAATGALVWSYQVGSPVRSPVAAGPDNDAYVGAENGVLYAFDTRNGTLAWSFTTAAPIRTMPALLLNLPGGVRMSVEEWRRKDREARRLRRSTGRSVSASSSTSSSSTSSSTFPGTTSVIVAGTDGTILACADMPAASATPTPSPTSSSTQSVTASGSASATASASASASGSASASAVSTPSASASSSASASASAVSTPSASVSITPSASITPSNTPTPSITPVVQSSAADAEKWAGVGVGSGVGLAVLGTVAFFAVTGRLSAAGIQTFLRSGGEGGDDGGEGGGGETQSLLPRDGVAAAAAAAASSSGEGAGVVAAESVALDADTTPPSAPADAKGTEAADGFVVRKGRYQPPPVRFGNEGASGV